MLLFLARFSNSNTYFPELTMRSNLRDAALIGAVSGLLFYLHALFPKSYLYPFVWPLIGGAMAVYLATRTSPALRGWAEALVLACGVGIVAGVFFLLPGIGTLYAIGRVAQESFPPLGGRTLSSLDRTMVVNSAIFAFVAIPATAVAGGTFLRLVLVRHRDVAIMSTILGLPNERCS